MELKDKTVLVTGADGFIGSHLVEALIEKQCHVKAFVYYNAFNRWGWLDSLSAELCDKIEIISGDIRDPHFVRNAMAGCDLVFHLAALIAIPYSYHAPDSYVHTNVQGTVNMLQAAKELQLEKFIHTSTSEVYGTAQTVPITENHPLNAQSPYAASKLAADQFAMSYYASFDLPISIVRPFNTYGPRQSARAIIPTVITQIADNHHRIQLGNLSPTRDFNYVEDTINGFIAIAESDQTIGEVINVGSNYEVSIEDTVQIISKEMRADIEIVDDTNRHRPDKSEVERLWADNAKALRLTEWRPMYAGLDGFKRGLRNTIAWFTQAENLNFYKTDRYNL